MNFRINTNDRYFSIVFFDNANSIDDCLRMIKKKYMKEKKKAYHLKINKLIPYKTIDYIEELISKNKLDALFISDFSLLEADENYNIKKKILLLEKKQDFFKKINVFEKNKILLTDLKMLSIQYDISIFIGKMNFSNRTLKKENVPYSRFSNIIFELKNRELKIVN